MSSDISSSPTAADRAAEAWRASGVVQPSRRLIVYSFIATSWLTSTTVRAEMEIIRPIVLTFKRGRSPGATKDLAPAQAAQRRGAEPQRDPARGGPARHRRGHRRALDQPARRGR